MSNLYRAHLVWKRISASQAIRYACFETLADGRFCVSAADFFRLPLDPVIQFHQDRNLIELLIEDDLSIRCSWFDTIAEAIARHDADFENFRRS